MTFSTKANAEDHGRKSVWYLHDRERDLCKTTKLTS